MTTAQIQAAKKPHQLDADRLAEKEYNDWLKLEHERAKKLGFANANAARAAGVYPGNDLQNEFARSKGFKDMSSMMEGHSGLYGSGPRKSSISLYMEHRENEKHADLYKKALKGEINLDQIDRHTDYTVSDLTNSSFEDKVNGSGNKEPRIPRFIPEPALPLPALQGPPAKTVEEEKSRRIAQAMQVAASRLKENPYDPKAQADNEYWSQYAELNRMSKTLGKLGSYFSYLQKLAIAERRAKSTPKTTTPQSRKKTGTPAIPRISTPAPKPQSTTQSQDPGFVNLPAPRISSTPAPSSSSGIQFRVIDDILRPIGATPASNEPEPTNSGMQ